MYLLIYIYLLLFILLFLLLLFNKKKKENFFEVKKILKFLHFYTCTHTH